MATFKDACFHYRRLTAINRRLLSIGANSTWSPAPDTGLKGWCLECCQIAELIYCYGCSLPHVCKWCVKDRRCFLDSQPHFLRLRTFKGPITKEKLQCIIDMYNMLFPVNDKVINKFRMTVKQNKCRNQYKLEWYNHLLMPITLNAAVFKFDDEVIYYVFGFYEGTVDGAFLPYRMVNCTDLYDKLLLDAVNMVRLESIPDNLKSHYTMKYFKASRMPSMKLKQIYFSDFAKHTAIFNTYTNTMGRYMCRNVTEFEWNTELEMHNDLKNNKAKIIAAMIATQYIQYNGHDNNVGRLKYNIFELGHHCKPNYISSNHITSASKIKNCKWCDMSYFFVKMDWRIRSMYDQLMNFIQSCYKSNVNVGHCSSVETIYPLIQRLIWHSFTPYMEKTIKDVFQKMNPTEIGDDTGILFTTRLDLELYESARRALQCEALPQILTQAQFSCIINAIVSQWFNVDKMEKLPLSIKSTEELRKMKEEGTLNEEYELLISDSEGDEVE
uniref:Non-structural protein 1 n=1 Tax=Rotavirus A TaxID=28875 RepID=A0A6M3QWX7_9REOV|nr:NSP1 [Rotavirus A]